MIAQTQPGSLDQVVEKLSTREAGSEPVQTDRSPLQHRSCRESSSLDWKKPNIINRPSRLWPRALGRTEARDKSINAPGFRPQETFLVLEAPESNHHGRRLGEKHPIVAGARLRSQYIAEHESRSVQEQHVTRRVYTLGGAPNTRTGLWKFRKNSRTDHLQIDPGASKGGCKSRHGWESL